ncbi:GNAT family N-acetyltransferase [Pseudomonas sp. RIT-PI-S]|uniref:GNAT family N-acetyltransferase n=1 Tax=Pseudomonas sp. RIT-PI-S TaxID=3035295 RepID=UPI0021D87140|nr:GNAT family N-acetyltransferase [Pseudomonas sp. RIT-PI-S]
MKKPTGECVISQLFTLPEDVLLLEKQAVAEGFRFMTRLVMEWESAENRFDKAGECLFGAFSDGHLVGIAGLSHDPRAGPEVGRLRRVYVTPGWRGQRVGKALVQRLLEQALGRFRRVQLFTDTPEAAQFYIRCGFHPIQDEFSTHAHLLTDLLRPPRHGE